MPRGSRRAVAAAPSAEDAACAASSSGGGSRSRSRGRSDPSSAAAAGASKAAAGSKPKSQPKSKSQSKPKSKSPFRCPKCDRTFKQQHGLDYHVRRNVCQDGRLRTPPNHSRGGTGGKYGPVAMRTCPHCRRVFSIVSGLAYHLQHRVCQKNKGKGNSKSKGKGRKGPRAKVTKEERRLAGTAPFPPLLPGQRFVTPYGVVEVVADDRIPEDYGATRVGGYDAAEVGRDGGEEEEEAGLVRLGRDCQRYRRSRERERERDERLWAQRVRSNLRKRRRLGRHYTHAARMAGLEAGPPTTTTTTQMVVWQESVATKTLTPDAILNYGATYRPPRDEGDVVGITFSARGGIREEEGAAHPAPAKVPRIEVADPLVPEDSYPDRIVTCRLIADRRQRIYDDCSARHAASAASASMESGRNGRAGKSGGGGGADGDLKPTESAWDIVLRAKELAERDKRGEANGKSGSRGGKSKDSSTAGKSTNEGDWRGGGEQEKDDEGPQQDEEKEDEASDESLSPIIISKLCLRRRLLTEPYEAAMPVFICRDCGKTLKSREGLREHVRMRVCQPPEPESNDSSEEEEEAIEEPVAVKTTSSGITLRARHRRKRKAYVEISSDDEEERGIGGGMKNRNNMKDKRKKAADDDDGEWDAAAADNDVQDDDDDVTSVVSEKEDEGPEAVEGPDDDPDILVVDTVPSNSPKRGKKRDRSSLASITTGKSRGRSRRGGNNRLAALADFDPDDDSSVEIMSVVSRSHRTPVKDRFGVDPDRRLSRKEWKRLKRPGWMQFKPEASSWYPEIMKCLCIKRGSNNQNWKRLKTERKRFEPVKNVRKERKAKQRLGDGPIYPSIMAKLNMWEGIGNKSMYPNVS